MNFRHEIEPRRPRGRDDGHVRPRSGWRPHARLLIAAAAAIAVLLFHTARGEAQPTQVGYQGDLLRNGSPFEGTAQMKFVLVDAGTARWSNDGSSATGEEPDTAVPVAVSDGLFGVILGGAGMVPLSPSAIAGLSALSLRIWVDTGDGFEQLPDQPVAASVFALHSESSERSFGGFTADGLVHSTTGGFKFPDGSVQTTAAAGSGGGGSLDQAYDYGGPGAGRSITADAGAVNLAGPSGLTVTGRVGIGATTRHGILSIASIGGNDTTKILAIDEGAYGSEFFLESGFAGTGASGNQIKLKTAWNNLAMSWRGDGKVGVGTTTPIGRLSVEHYGDGVSDPALHLKNTSPGGHALYADATGPEPTVVLENHGGGPYVRGRLGANTVFEVTQAGKLYGRFLEISGGGPFQVDGNGKVRVAGTFGNGAAGAPVYIDNQSSGGIALWGKVTSSDATAVLEQYGTGDLLRGFRNGQLKFQVTNSGRVVTTALQITGGGDLAEPFTISGGDEVEAGTVLVIDESRPGQLRVSDRAYDHRVAGVVSGAGGLNPGISLVPEGHQDGGQNVALTGRVYDRADASHGAIRPGDLLTTADRPGHLMRAADPARATGAVLGKAMSGLENGTGLVLVLVSLQ